jgi:hypothetical protein
MTPEQQQHLDTLCAQIVSGVSEKYEAGQREHGGDLWKKRGMLRAAIDEANDLQVYLRTLLQQLDRLYIEGHIDRFAHQELTGLIGD